MGQGLLIVDA